MVAHTSDNATQTTQSTNDSDDDDGKLGLLVLVGVLGLKEKIEMTTEFQRTDNSTSEKTEDKWADYLMGQPLYFNCWKWRMYKEYF